MIIEVCVTRHFIAAREECVGQGTTLSIKRVPIIMQQTVKRHSDVASSCHPAVVSWWDLMETQGGRIAPGFKGKSEDCYYHSIGQAGWVWARRVAVDTVDRQDKDLSLLYVVVCIFGVIMTLFGIK